MKIVINYDWGKFKLPKEIADALDCSEWDDSFENRTNLILIDYLENTKDLVTSLVVLEIPDDITDLFIQDYDGIETVVFVIDGKLHTIKPFMDKPMPIGEF